MTMIPVIRRWVLISGLGLWSVIASWGGPRAAIPLRAADPYMGAFLVSAEGEVLFEDHADAPVYPASTIKLMNLLLILEGIERGAFRPEDPVAITAAASTMGGTQVFLKENEVFPLQELLYAMVVQSANDAAVALAIRIAGSKEGFVDLMNRRAAELDMRKTRFHSVHGLPPAEGQEPDISTPRDMARLCLALLKKPEALRYTSVIKRPFRADSPSPFIMENHNRLLGTFEGCDGLKTGYIKAGGYSIAATAQRGGQRVVAVVMGSLQRETRDAKTRELLARGLNDLARRPAPPKVPAASTQAVTRLPEEETPPSPADGVRPVWKWIAGFIALLLVVGGLGWLKRPRFR